MNTHMLVYKLGTWVEFEHLRFDQLEAHVGSKIQAWTDHNFEQAQPNFTSGRVRQWSWGLVRPKVAALSLNIK